MSNKSLKYITQGIALALLIYVTASTVVPVLFTNAYAQSPGLFSVTLIAPTGGNAARRQYASIITGNLISLGIDAKLFYVTFDQLANRLFAATAPPGSSFSQGGYDIGFIGWGYTAFVPDFRTNFDGRPAYLPPTGNNYAYYNNPTVNSIFDKLYTTTDTATQVQLTHQFQEQVFNDAPYNYIYELIDPVPRASKFSAWGNNTLYSEVTFPDIQHWSGSDSLTMAEAANVFPGNNLNPIITSASNSFYALYIYGEIVGGSGNGGGAALQEADPRCGCYVMGSAQNITSSPDGLTWTVNIKPGVMFQSGVEVTSDDFLYTTWAGLRPDAASVGLGSSIQYLGSKVNFTWLNGTTTTVDNTSPATPETDGSWVATSKYQFQFKLPQVYAFTRLTFAQIAPLPKHIMEQFAPSTWDSAPFSTASGPYTYHWDTSKYGGSGSYTAVGPVGAGPYKLDNYDFTNNIATLSRFDGYYNASGLEALGQFSIKTYKVQWINSKDAAIAALKNGQVDLLDYNYGLPKDRPTLEAIPNVNVITCPELGWQEMGINMNNPVFGTGTDTPAGKANPSAAADAARDIRKAISHVIPRDLIVSELLAGAAYPLASFLGPGWGQWYDPSLTPDSYDLNAAASLLQQAGYSVTVAPPAPIAYSGSPMLGSGSVTISGTGPVANMLLMIQQSTDGGNTWADFAPTMTDNSSKYQVSAPAPPAFGSVMYRANFTGIVPTDDIVASIRNGTTPLDMAKFQEIQSTPDDWQGGRVLWTPTSAEPQLTTPITVSSASTDATVVAVPIVIIVLAVIGAAVFLKRKKKTAPAK
ncbi:MAG TPA: ABC transporter substrate-binding protein [Terriglobales bacterium]|nr:ABC transporter substrate-binding protein [Terriglobales bacterium]